VVIISADTYNQTENMLYLYLIAQETGLDSDSTALVGHTRFIDWPPKGA